MAEHSYRTYGKMAVTVGWVGPQEAGGSSGYVVGVVGGAGWTCVMWRRVLEEGWCREAW